MTYTDPNAGLTPEQISERTVKLSYAEFLAERRAAIANKNAQPTANERRLAAILKES